MISFQQQLFKEPSVDLFLQLWPSFGLRLVFFDFFIAVTSAFVPDEFLTHSKLSAAPLLFSAAYFIIISLNSAV